MYEFLIVGIGLSLLIMLSSFGSSHAISAASTSSIMYTQKKSILTQAYIAVIMTSTIFMYGLILAMVMIFRLPQLNSLNLAFKQFIACLTYGGCAYFSGLTMGSTCKNGFNVLSKNPSFFLVFILLMSGIEAMLIFALVISLFMITTK